MAIQDKVIDSREGEELDVGVVDQYMRGRVNGLEGELTIKQFPAGASNLTYLLKYDNKAFVLRRPPFGHKAKSAHDMGREHRVMANLKEQFPYVPEMIAYETDESILGAEFYVMEKLDGIILRTNMPKGLELDEQQVRGLCLSFIDKLVDLHKVDYKAAGLGDLGEAEGYISRQIEGWYDRYQQAGTDDAPDAEPVLLWMRKQQPTEVKGCLVHNDYRLDNVVLDHNDPSRITGVLDWEMSTLGDPLMDLGVTISYWVEPGDDELIQLVRRQPSNVPGMLSRREFVDYYAERSGIPIKDFTFYEVYGYFRLAVALQQMYYRFQQGQTKDERFGLLLPIIEIYINWCKRLIAE